MDVGGLSANLSGASGTAVVSSGSATTYTGSLDTSTVGMALSQSFSLNAGDQQSLPGANPLSTLSQNVTLNVLGHANPQLNVVGGNNQTVITGASVSASLCLSNPGTNLSPLDVGGLSANLSGTSGTAVVSSGSATTYTGSLDTSTVGMALSQSFSLNAGDQQSLPGANPLSTLSQNVTLNVLGHANPQLSVVGGNNQTVITGASVSASLCLSNPGTNLSPLDVGGLSANLSGASGTAVVSSGSATTYTGSLDTSTVGMALSQSFSLNAGDQQSLPGANPLSALSQNVTLNVLGHANPQLSVVGGNNQTVITGASVSASLCLTNPGTNLSPLDVGGLSGRPERLQRHGRGVLGRHGHTIPAAWTPAPWAWPFHSPSASMRAISRACRGPIP